MIRWTIISCTNRPICARVLIPCADWSALKWIAIPWVAKCLYLWTAPAPQSRFFAGSVEGWCWKIHQGWSQSAQTGFWGHKILPKSNAGSSLLAYLLVSKYQDHLPFYRQIEIFKRSNIHLAASTINGWFVRSPWAEKTTSSVRTTKQHNIRSSFTPFWVPAK